MLRQKLLTVSVAVLAVVGLLSISIPLTPSHAEDEATGDRAGRLLILKKLREHRNNNEDGAIDANNGGSGPRSGSAPMSEQGFKVFGKGQAVTQTIDGRAVIVYTPPRPLARGSIPLVVALHGGFGSGKQIRSYVGLEPYADQYGFMIAYPDGTKVAKRLPEKFKGWNGGECCGQPSEDNIDDVGFLTRMVNALVQNNGVDPYQVYGTGHSNGSIMTMRMMCETNLYRAAVAYSGPLSIEVQSCPPARGKRILAIHGVNDQNCPINGGYTKVGMNKKTNYRPQSYTQKVFQNSDADFTLLALQGAEHKPETLNYALIQTEGVTLPQKIVAFLGLDRR